MEILTLIAILIGPVVAIIVARYLESGRDTKARRMDIFRTLMRTRRTPIFPEHVGALNLIEIEFAKDEKVMIAWKKLFEHLGSPHPKLDKEIPKENADQETINNCDRIFSERIVVERQKLLAQLLHAIAKKLGFKAEQLELFDGGYTPQGWHNVEQEQQDIRSFTLDLASGRRFVPVGVFDLRSMPATDDSNKTTASKTLGPV